MTTNKSVENFGNRLGIVSLVLGLLSLLFLFFLGRMIGNEDGADAIMYYEMACCGLGFITGFPAIVTGIISLTQFRKCIKLNMGLAIAGTVMGVLSLLFMVILNIYK